MKRIFKPTPECGDYARFPQYVHEEVERDGHIIEEIRQLSPEEIINRASAAPSPDISDNSGRLYQSSDYKDGFAALDSLENQIDNIDVEQFNENK